MLLGRDGFGKNMSKDLKKVGCICVRNFDGHIIPQNPVKDNTDFNKHSYNL